ncbi:hypothetical protein E8E01_11815 [Methylorubrum populi]|uniref:hypothetical protein n=1 Tax=Methylorubrum populi TaxID=223967 RepID=UPI001154AD59|nr:hypothetical protein [Methylorubrum populi]QDI81073.1 hypothetical protein E8E01_11815 [Methylorubrum populi]
MFITTLPLVGFYTLLGFALWETAVVGSAADDPLSACELNGARSTAEALAFLTVKGLFVALWPVCIAFYGLAQGILRLRVR